MSGAFGKPRRQFLPQRKTLEDDSGVVIYRVHQKLRAVTIAWSTTVPQALDGCRVADWVKGSVAKNTADVLSTPPLDVHPYRLMGAGQYLSGESSGHAEESFMRLVRE